MPWKKYFISFKRLKEGARFIAEGSMSAAVMEIKEKYGISVDGTWQKRGFASLNGVVVAISTSNFKVVDVETMPWNDKACISKENLCKENVRRIEREPWTRVQC